MESRTPASNVATANLPVVATAPTLPAGATSRVLHNTHALLSLTLLLSAGVAAMLAGLAAAFLQVPMPGLVVTAMVVLLWAGLILAETSRIVHGGEASYVLATVGLGRSDE